MVFTGRWSLYRGGHIYRFDCKCFSVEAIEFFSHKGLKNCSPHCPILCPDNLMFLHTGIVNYILSSFRGFKHYLAHSVLNFYSTIPSHERCFAFVSATARGEIMVSGVVDLKMRSPWLLLCAVVLLQLSVSVRCHGNSQRGSTTRMEQDRPTGFHDPKVVQDQE